MLSPRRGNGFMLFLIVFQAVFTIILSLVMLALLKYFSEGALNNFLVITQDIFIFLIPIMIYLVFTKSSLGSVIPHSRLSPKNILYILVLTLLFAPVISVISSITALFAPTDVNNEILDILDSSPFIISFLSMAVMPAVFEEMTFRGVLLSNYKSAGIAKAAAVSALFFGLIHGNLYQIIYAVAAGIFFAVLVAYTNSIFASILSHLLFNGVQVIMTEVALNFADVSELMGNTPTLQENLTVIVMDLFITVITLPFLILLFRKFMEYNEHNALDYRYSIKEKTLDTLSINIDDSEDGRSVIDPYFIIAVIVCIVMAIVSMLM